MCQEGHGASLVDFVSGKNFSYAMDTTSYILFKGNKRLTLREDMNGDKIARIFQVSSTFFVCLENMLRPKDAMHSTRIAG